MQKDLAKTLREEMTKRLDYRSRQIGNRLQVMEALLPGAEGAVYQQLYELSGQVERANQLFAAVLESREGTEKER